MSQQVLREILLDIQKNLVPKSMFRDWALSTFPSPSDYWMFRKIVSRKFLHILLVLESKLMMYYFFNPLQFTQQLCLSGFAEYVFHLTRLNPDILFLHKDSGMVNISYFKFDLDDSTGEFETNVTEDPETLKSF